MNVEAYTRVRVDHVDDTTLDVILETMGRRPGWQRAARMLQALTRKERVPPTELPSDRLLPVIRLALAEIDARVEFSGRASLADLTTGDRPERILEALAATPPPELSPGTERPRPS